MVLTWKSATENTFGGVPVVWQWVSNQATVTEADSGPEFVHGRALDFVMLDFAADFAAKHRPDLRLPDEP